MRLIFVRSTGPSRTFECSRRLLYALSAFLLVGVLCSIFFVNRLVQQAEALNQEIFPIWLEILDEQKEVIVDLGERADNQGQMVTSRLANLRARLLRLESLGSDLVEVSKLDSSEFDFSIPLSIGGMVRKESDSPSWGQLQQDLDNFSQLLKRRETELTILNSVLSEKQLIEESRPNGHPVEGGWTSSAYGQRIDPFRGVKAWHAGVDITSLNKEAPVKALARGLVVFSGERQGYGKMVEVDHANGYKTRYAHHRELLVEAGEIIEKGEPVGVKGNTGRSPAPHEHIEVLRNGKNVNPARFLVNN